MKFRVRESRIENYFVQQVTRAGGRALKFTGYRNAPDRLVIWPRGHFGAAPVHFVELKAPQGRIRAGQKREHERLREMGCTVLVIKTKMHVDGYVEAYRYRYG